MIGIIDSANLAFRFLFSGNDPLKASGFAIKGIIELVENFNLEGVLVVWDGGSARRKEFYPQYKANRKLDQIQIEEYHKLLKEINQTLQYCGIPQIRLSGEEADDIIATLIKNMFKDDKVLLCSNDRDFYSLLSDNVLIWDWKEIKNIPWFKREFGIEPQDWVKVRSLVGDSSDNIEGVSGIGIKKGLKIVQDGLYKDFQDREDVKLYHRVLSFLDVPEERILNGLDVGELNKFKFYQTMEYCGLGIDLWDKVLNLSRKDRVRRWKLNKINSTMSECKACPLWEKQSIDMFHGNISDVLIVGDSPTNWEPQVERWFNTIGLGMQDRFLTSNVMWHRTQKEDGSYRAPKDKEIDTCSKLGLTPLINSLAPRLVIAIGNAAAKFVFGSSLNFVKDSGRYRVERFGFPFWVWLLPTPESAIGRSKMQNIVYTQMKEIDKFIREGGMI